MKFLRSLTLLLAIFAFSAGSNALKAQITMTSEEDKQEEKSSFKQRLWYGGNVGFNLANYGNNATQMYIGLSPMVGYKFNEFLSAGPRASLDYYEIYITGQNPRLLYWGIGAFTRAKITDFLFGQVEYEFRGVSKLNERSKSFAADLDDTRSAYIGVGYQSGGGNNALGYEIMALYDLTTGDSGQSPIIFRMGFNWNF